MKIAIVGPGRSGKDEAAEWFRDHTPLRYAGATSEVISRSMAAKWGVSFGHAHAVRHEHRAEWFQEGIRLRGTDPAHLARTTLEASEICVGIRDRAEMEVTRSEGLVDLVLWIDRPGLAVDPTLKFGTELADLVVPNRWGLPEFHQRLRRLANSWGLKTW